MAGESFSVKQIRKRCDDHVEKQREGMFSVVQRTNTNTVPEGNAQTPENFDRSRISPQIREALRDHSPEIREGVKRVADAPPTPSSGLVK